MRAFEKLVCGRSRAAEIANMGGFNRRGQAEARYNCVWGLSQKWEGGLVFEKLVYGSMERAAEIPKTIPLAKKGIGM